MIESASAGVNAYSNSSNVVLLSCPCVTFRTAMSNDWPWDKKTKRNGAFTPNPPSLACALMTWPSEESGSVILVKPIKSISWFDVEIKLDSKNVVLPSGTTSSKQSQCSKFAHPNSSIQSTPVSASGLENWSTANAWSIVIKTIVDVNKNGSKTRTKKYFCFSLMLFFCVVKSLGSSLIR